MRVISRRIRTLKLTALRILLREYMVSPNLLNLEDKLEAASAILQMKSKLPHRKRTLHSLPNRISTNLMVA